MNYCPVARQSRGEARKTWPFVVAVVAVVVMALGLAAVAEGADAAWRVEPVLDVRQVTYYRHVAGRDRTYPALGVKLGIELTSDARPVVAGLFVDQECTGQSDRNSVQLTGAWVRYRFNRWELSTSGVHVAISQANSRWMRVSKVQFEPVAGHKFAVEMIGPLHGGGRPMTQLAYARNLTPRLSLTLNLGVGANRQQDFGATSKFMWTLR